MYQMSSDLCFPVDNPISSLYSTWRSCKRDRIWSFTCQNAGGDKKCSEWTDWVNEWDGPLFKICDKNGYISGVYSEHDNGKEDRRRVTRLTLLILLSSNLSSTIHTPHPSKMKLISRRFTEGKCFVAAGQSFLRGYFKTSQVFLCFEVKILVKSNTSKLRAFSYKRCVYIVSITCVLGKKESEFSQQKSNL